MTPTATSHCIDDGKSRFVAVAEGTRARFHVTKYGPQSTVCITTFMDEGDAYELGIWLLANTKPRPKAKK